MKIIIERHLEPFIIDFINEITYINDGVRPLSYFHNEILFTIDAYKVELDKVYEYFDNVIKAYNEILSGKRQCSNSEMRIIKRIDRKYKLTKIMDENSN